MPTYEFECKRCGETFTLFTTISDRDNALCPICGSGELRQLFTGVSFTKGGSGGSSSGGCSKGSCGGCSGC